MKKGERLDIDLSVIAIEPIPDELAELTAQKALQAARRVFEDYPLHFKRLTGGISIHSSVRRLHPRGAFRVRFRCALASASIQLMNTGRRIANARPGDRRLKPCANCGHGKSWHVLRGVAGLACAIQNCPCLAFVPKPPSEEPGLAAERRTA